ncbi:uncharacterized protein ACHE_80397A [Aspergillus chevalieri]|uniref:Uncharacterized protein n=1 Tax=Aspergillus chevalieri TaxID=182096 RepID=A0A7R7VXB9_ASPCH|nr:uncharacterized protein ACHE_80397A [Aspergillus chevalieri]BCR92497.1 hypothetical protein ACHE_80397A [Aspergillus chevalieri]
MLPRTPILSLLRNAAKPVTAPTPARYFSTSPALKNTGSTLPAKKPVGAFRGGVLGFLAGSVTAGTLVYYYILQEYRTANEMLSEDIYVCSPLSLFLRGSAFSHSPYPERGCPVFWSTDGFSF